MAGPLAVAAWMRELYDLYPVRSDPQSVPGSPRG